MHQSHTTGLPLNSSELQGLKQGDVIRHLSSGDGFIVHSNYGDRVTAARAFDITNHDEWNLGVAGTRELEPGMVICHKDGSTGYVVT